MTCKIATRLGAVFPPSNGWLDHFRERYSIVYRQVCRESTAVNAEDVNCWKNNVLCVANEQVLKQQYPDIYNVDDLGLKKKLMPDETMVFKDEKSSRVKQSRTNWIKYEWNRNIKTPCHWQIAESLLLKNARNLLCDYKSQSKDKRFIHELNPQIR